MNGLSILGYCLAIVGVLTVIWGATLFRPNLTDSRFMSFATSGVILAAIGLLHFRGPARSVSRRDLGGNVDHDNLHLVAA